MKKLLLLIFVIPITIVGQMPELKLTRISVIEPVIVEVSNKTASDLYKSTNDWLNLIYKNPNKVIKGSVENDFIRFQGMKSGFAYIEVMKAKFSFDLEYTIRVDVKDNKYRFTLENYAIISPATEYGLSRSTLELYEQKPYQDRNGNIKQKYLKYYDSYSAGLLKEINNINKSLYDYLIGKTKEIKDDW